MTLWVFGDSYAQQYPGLEDQWMQQVANTIGTDVKSFGLVGSTIEYTSMQFNSARKNIKQGDVVIIALTSHNRRWFFKDYPTHTGQPIEDTTIMSPVFDYSPTGYNEIDEALNLYEINLKNQEVNDACLYNFLYNINSFAKNIHTILLVNFFDCEYAANRIKKELTHLHIAHEKMIMPSLMEYTKKHLLEVTDHLLDTRVNHLCRRNHYVLAKKIIANIEHNKVIDLSREFHEDFYDYSCLEDSEFYNNELFHGIVFDTRMQ